MRKPGHATLAAALVLLLLAVIALLAPEVGSGVLNSEKVFIAGLHNSLYYLDRAKWQWAKAKHKSEGDIPAMADLTPYLGYRTNGIERFIKLGITYEITPFSEIDQSDIATLTRSLRFRSGFCRFYPAGTRYCLRTNWSFPDSGRPSFRAFYVNNRELFAVALFLSSMGTLLVFVVRKILSSRKVRSVAHEHQNA